MLKRVLPPLVALIPTVALAETPAPRVVDVTAADGAMLKATYYAAGAPGPAVLLLHMCNTDRRSWDPVGRQLSAAGIHALALDYRGYGESSGDRFTELPPPARQKLVSEKWVGDIDAAYAFLVSQEGVDKTRVGAGGGSCGVTQAVNVARRHPEVKSLVLLAGPTDAGGRRFLLQNAWLPVFTSAAADDQFGASVITEMQWLSELSGNPRNSFVGFKDGKHGTEIFGPHPELPQQIVAWYVDTLVKTPADPTMPVTAKPTPASEFWKALDTPDGATRAAALFHEARQKDPNAYLFPESVLNLSGYEKLQAGATKDAVAIFQLNVEAYPQSANAQDSLGDGYLADGQKDLALAAAKKCLEMLAADPGTEEYKKAIRASAEEKIAKLQ
jgi:pimeloyl-ACP methyl ester carboxylesterase